MKLISYLSTAMLVLLISGCGNASDNKKTKDDSDNGKIGDDNNKLECVISGDVSKSVNLTGSDNVNAALYFDEGKDSMRLFISASQDTTFYISPGMLFIDKKKIIGDGEGAGGMIGFAMSEDQGITYSNALYPYMFDDLWGTPGYHNNHCEITFTEMKYYETEEKYFNKWYNIKGTFKFMAAEQPLNDRTNEINEGIIRLHIAGMTRTQAATALGVKKVSCIGKFDVWCRVEKKYF